MFKWMQQSLIAFGTLTQLEVQLDMLLAAHRAGARLRARILRMFQ